ncbi:hypothetical protein BBZ73_07805 [Neisseria gonorrhoeae]|nr:hypothetical protein ASO12_09710 [Neisseria gonorrhoeae]KLR86360.1 hypothetical protein M675_08215 [Neisseria gonorrhoeae SK1902]KLR95002.1 hypothetical protein M678_01090 [Neisseria gonorrhoeae SK7461]KLS01139.1 hypothetical protein M688_03005 [Neisseria gonorrhoeae SK22871]KLS17806.1 hypothetical protein M719_04730 [Neisseria gonorrhoeae SK36809]KLS31936.1 hypothetical protein M721_08830 [Neisseria gonorrhoeae ALB_2011_03_03]KLS43877.1 hypothetical protein M797_08710 [Neisseria gonorrhoe
MCFPLKRPVHQPENTQPAMFASPMMAMDVEATVAGSPHRATSVGRWVTRKAMWKPQAKKLRCSRM